MKEKKITRYFH